MACDTSDTSVVVSFKTLFGMLSGPDDLPMFKSFRSFSTSPVVISRLSMSGNLASVHCWMVDMSSFVKTHWNCLLISSALSLFSLLGRLPLDLGAMPVLSLRLLLMYLQNGLLPL